MTQRERLITKIMSLNKPTISLQTAMDIVDAIIDEGVIVLPCKVGDTVWITVWWGANCTLVELKKPEQRKVMYFALTKDGLDVHFKDGAWNVNAFNNFIFLTREEAEKALKERGENCKNCKHLMFSDCYGECGKAYKGIVNPDDTCEHFERRTKQ